MKAVVQCDLLSVWTEKERELGRRLKVSEVAKATNVHRDTITRFLNEGDKIERLDMGAAAKLAVYFDVTDGEPVPFLKVKYVEEDA